MAGIGIISNPHSKLNKKAPQRQQLLSYIAGEQGQVRITQDLFELKKAAQSFFDRKIDILAINGGDGTISQTLSAFIEVYEKTPLPPVAILGGGTINMLAKNLNLKSLPEQNLYRLIEKYSAAEKLSHKLIPTLRVEKHYGFLFANGVSAQFLEEFYKKKSNTIGSIFLVLKILFSYLIKGKLFKRIVQQSRYLISLNKTQPIEHFSCSLICATIEKMPLGVPLFPREKISHFDIVSMVAKPEHLAKSFLLDGLLFAKENSPRKLRFSATDLEIATQTDQLYTLDGELFKTEASVNLALGPQIKFLLY